MPGDSKNAFLHWGDVLGSVYLQCVSDQVDGVPGGQPPGGPKFYDSADLQIHKWGHGEQSNSLRGQYDKTIRALQQLQQALGQVFFLQLLFP